MRKTIIQILGISMSKRSLAFEFLSALHENGVRNIAINASKKKSEWLNIQISGKQHHETALKLIARRRLSLLREAMIIVREGQSGWDDYSEIFNSFR